MKDTYKRAQKKLRHFDTHENPRQSEDDEYVIIQKRWCHVTGSSKSFI